MNIALDYDDTYTRDPKLWDLFLGYAKARGHRVFFCTCRGPNPDENRDMIIPSGIECYYTNGASKRPFMYDRGIMVDVWIDDMPEMITDGTILIG